MIFLVINSANAFISSAPLEDFLIKGDAKEVLLEIEKQKKDLSPQDYALVKSNAYILMRDWKNALELLTPLYNSDSRNPLIANNYAVALWGMDKKDDAKNVLEKSLSSNSIAFRNLRKIYLSNAADAYSRALDTKGVSSNIDLLSGTKIGGEISPRPLKAPLSPVDGTIVADSKISAPDKSGSKRENKTDKTLENVPTGQDKKKIAGSEIINSEHSVLENNIQAWVSAWSNKNIKLYLSFYSSNFKPEGGLSYSEWIEQRTQRVTKPGPISVRAEIISFSGESKRVTVKLHQTYSSTNLKSDLVKNLEFTNEQGKWLITREFNK
jgi:hypothetical protein